MNSAVIFALSLSRPSGLGGRPRTRKRCANDKGRDHSRPLRCSAWRRYQVRRDMLSLSQGFFASLVLAGSSMRGRPSPRLHVRNCEAMALYRRTLCRLLAMLALIGVGGCSASGPEPPFETAYSAIGAQVK